MDPQKFHVKSLKLEFALKLISFDVNLQRPRVCLEVFLPNRPAASLRPRPLHRRWQNSFHPCEGKRKVLGKFHKLLGRHQNQRRAQADQRGNSLHREQDGHQDNGREGQNRPGGPVRRRQGDWGNRQLDHQPELRDRQPGSNSVDREITVADIQANCQQNSWALHVGATFSLEDFNLT